MKSGTSFFNRSFSLHLLRRFWPLWALWLALLLLVGPIVVTSAPPESYESLAEYANDLNHALLSSGVAAAELAIFAAPAMAMAMLSWLYAPRTCAMVCALPMRRETLWFTSVLTGLVPMLAAEGLSFLVLLLRVWRVPGVVPGHAVLWLVLSALSTVAFFGMACFCGVLTGNVLVLPAVYAVLGCAAVVAEATVRALLGVLVYGYSYGSLTLEGLSPLVHLFGALRVVGSSKPGEALSALSPRWSVLGLDYLAILAAAGVLLSLLALPILRRRHMECAGETVAVPLLRPVFRVCMAVGCGVVGATLACETVLSRLLVGRGMAAAALILLCVFAALGFFAAQMLMKKTLRVFDRGWKQLGVICVCLTLPFLLAEWDVFGYETRVPDPADVASVQLPHGRTETLTDPESIAAYCEAHRVFVANKARDEGRRRRSTTITLEYALRDGGRLRRLYSIPIRDEDEGDPTASATAYETLLNCPEALLRRAGADVGVTAAAVRSAAVSVQRPADDPIKGWEEQSFRLTPEQAESLWRDGVLPDAREGRICRRFVYFGEEQEREGSNVSLRLELEKEPVAAPDEGERVSRDASYYYLDVQMSSAHTIRWLQDNLNVTPENSAALARRLESAVESIVP